jgi:hypothetical protein
VVNLLKRVSVYFSAGAFGGLVNGLGAWFLGKAGVTAALGVSIAPALSPSMLYQRVVWGGISTAWRRASSNSSSSSRRWPTGG